MVIGAGRVLQALIGLGAIRIATQYLSPAEMGIFAIILAIHGYFGLTFSNPIGLYMTRFVNEWNEQKTVSTRFLWFLIYLLGVSALYFLVSYVLSSQFQLFREQRHVEISLLLVLFFLSQTIVNSFGNLLNMVGRQVIYVTLSVLSLGSALLMSFLFVDHYDSTAFNWVFGQSIAYLIFVPIVIGISLSHFGKISMEQIQLDYQNRKQKFSEIFHYAGPLVLSTGLLWAYTEGFRFPIEATQGLQYLGLVSVGMLIAQRCGVAVETITTQVFSPIFFKSIVGADKKIREEKWNDFYSQSVPIYIVTAFFLMGMSPFLGRILAGAEFQSSWGFIMIGVGIQSLRSIGNLFVTVAHSEKNTKSLVVPYFVSSLAAIGVVWAVGGFAEWYYYGIPLGLLLATGFGSTYLAHKMNQQLPTHFGLRNYLKFIGIGLPFLLALLLSDYHRSLSHSIGIIGFSGVVFCLLVYQFHLRQLKGKLK